MKINLFTCHWECDSTSRQKELNYCLEKNKENPLISHPIFNFTDRPTYRDFFDATQGYPNDVNILANADIYFNNTLEYVKFLNPNECYALTRWEDYKEQIIKFEVRHSYNKEAKPQHSQDVWMFKGAVSTRVYGDFYLGIPGCDNRIAREISRHYHILNPCETIQSIHKHEKAVRTYNTPEGTPKRITGPYTWVWPCEITPDGQIRKVTPAAPPRRRVVRG